ncbi:MAG: DivIVA domain-containing protein [Demequina sp.]|jgi:DivIVA domain-containing protein|nr:DivIVA domain-containing protein [Demequina sp.]
MSELFPRTSALRHGYDRGQVEEFFSRARQAYERAAAPGAELSPLEVRRASFDLKRGGYSTAAVDSALDRLEIAFAKRTRETFVRQHGQDAWMQDLAQRAQVLYPRLRRPKGERFAHPGFVSRGYDAREVDKVLARVTSFFDRGEPLTAQQVRMVAFAQATGKRAYDEATVDAFLARTVDILLGVGEG